MKNIILSLLFMFSVNMANGQELISVNDALKQGLEVRMGELTGAGSKFSVNNLAGFLLPDGVILRSNCQEITLKNTTDPKISDILKISFANQEINASEFIGFIIK